jgi:hypothetical protein
MLAAALAVVASAAIAAPAGARTPQPTTAQVVGPVVIDKNDPTVAYLKAKYRCTGEGTLWISVKQTAARRIRRSLGKGRARSRPRGR